MPTPLPPHSTVIPAMRYRDATAAIDWLCRVIGFETHLVVAGPGNSVAHAQLALGGGMRMLGSADNGSDYGGRGFSCLDPEGRLWNIGTYDPWA